MYIAIDIGATKTLIACFSRGGRCLKRSKFLTSQNQSDFIKDLTAHLQPFQFYSVSAITVAIPGIVQKNCSFIFGNLPWPDIDLTTPIKTLFRCPIYFVNDADLATIYESYFCSGRVVYLTFSTGIGGGIAKDGRLTPASRTFEPGHRQYRWAGKLTEWEDFASARAIKAAHHDTNVTLLRKKATFIDIAARLTPGLVSIITDERPELIVIGGPLGLTFSKFRPYLRANLLKELPRQALPKIIPARRPTESVIYGCYLYARSKDQ